MTSSPATPVILAGGLGSRLRPVIGERQKVVSGSGGRPFVFRILERLAKAGFNKALLCVGYKAEEVAASLGSSCCGVSLDYSVESSPLGTGGALRLAIGKTGSERLLVMNGDSFIDADLGSFIAFSCGKAASMLLRRADDASRYGKVILSDDAKIRSFEEKSPLSGPGLVNAGVYVLDSNLVETHFQPGFPASLERDFFPALSSKGLLYGLESHGAFIDIGTPESFKAADSFFEELNGN